MYRLIIVLVAVIAASIPSRGNPLRVASVTSQKPFSQLTGNEWSGFTVTLWERIAQANNWQYTFISYDNEDDAVTALAAKQVDVVAAATSITASRLDRVAFSQPYFRTGLQLMVNESRPYTFNRLRQDVAFVLQSKFLWVIAGVIFVMTIVVFFFERKYNPHFPKNWVDGLSESFLYVVAVAATSTSRKALPGPLGAFAVAAWTIIGTITVAFITSVITNFMATDRVNSHIAEPRDLVGHVAGVINGTSAADYLRQHFIQATEYPSLKDAVAALIDGKVSAVVGDAAALQYYDQTHPELPITEVGPVFEPQEYGFAIQIGSSLQQPIDHALCQAIETGERGRIGRRYFGEVYAP